MCLVMEEIHVKRRRGFPGTGPHRPVPLLRGRIPGAAAEAYGGQIAGLPAPGTKDTEEIQ